MRIILTGTPCTGKSAIAKELREKLDYKLVYLSGIVEKKKLWKKKDKFGTKIVQLEKLEKEINKIVPRERDLIIEGHLACEFKIKNVDFVIVCRTNPKTLERRLRGRNYPEKKIYDNIMSELLDYCTILSLQNYKKVYEIETSKSVRANVNEILKIINGKGEQFRAGWVNWSKELERRIIGSSRPK
jgi:adenylate kinase